MSHLKRFSLKVQTWFVSGLIAIILLSSSVVNLIEIKHELYTYQKLETKSVVTEAKSIAEYFYKLQQEGKMSEYQARKFALDVINNITYGDNNYVFVYSYDYVLLANRSRPDLVGQYRRDKAVSPDGVKYVRLGVDIAKSGGGYYSYTYNAGGVSANRIKTSYSAGFDPWGWMIGSGSYLDVLDSLLFWHYFLVIATFFLGLFFGMKLLKMFTDSVMTTSFSWLKDINSRLK